MAGGGFDTWVLGAGAEFAGFVRFGDRRRGVLIVGGGCSAWFGRGVVVGVARGLKIGVLAVGEVAAVAPVPLLMGCDVWAHRSAPGIPTASAASVSPILPPLDAWMCLCFFRTWRDLRRRRGSARPGSRVPCPPTFRIPLAISKIRLGDLRQSSLRIPMSARIVDPRFCASWIRARRLWLSFLGCCILRFLLVGSAFLLESVMVERRCLTGFSHEECFLGDFKFQQHAMV